MDNGVNAHEKRLHGLRLKAARIALGYNQPRGKTQEAFYAQIGESKSKGNNWEKGTALPRHDSYVNLYRRFEIGPDWLLLERPGGLPDRLAAEIVKNFIKMKGE